MTALPVEPPSAQAEQVPGHGDGTPPPLTYREPESAGSVRVDRLTDFPLEVWARKPGRRLVILRPTKNWLDQSMLSFVCRWLDEDREWTWTLNQSALVQVIGAFDIHNTNPDWVRKNVDPHYEHAKAERRQGRRR